jgi:5-methylcytosine-specific restriction endonuclease McrA
MDELISLESVTVNGEVVYVNRFGDLWRWKHPHSSCPKFRRIVCRPGGRGYIHPHINGKCVLQHRIIAAAFLGLDITDLKIQVDHINGIRTDNRFENLRLVTPQQNQWNRTTAKGYCWKERDRKWSAQIKIDGKKHHIGCFDTEENARDAYLNAKELFHIIPK